MELEIAERLALQSILPQKDNVINLINRKSVLEKAGLTEEDLERYGFKTLPNGGASWTSEEKIEVEFSESELEYLKGVINTLDQKKELHFESLSLAQKIRG